MKILILISCLIAVSYASTNDVVDGLLNSFKQAAIKCKLDIDLTEDDMAEIKAQKIPTSTTGKCFIACIHKKLNFMTEDGKFNKELGYQFIEKMKDIDAELYGKFKKLADTCYAEVHEVADACESATNMLVCVKREKDALGIHLNILKNM